MSTPARKDSAAGSYHHGDLRRALIRSGRELLSEGGPGALTLRAAATRVGVSVAAPYRHFADKDALLTAVLADSLRDLQQSFGADASIDPLARLHALGHQFVDLAVAEPELFRLLAASEVTRANDGDLADALETLFGSFSASIDEAIDANVIEVDSAETALLVMRCVIHGLTGLIAQSAVPRETAHEIADQVMATIDRGLLPRP